MFKMLMPGGELGKQKDTYALEKRWCHHNYLTHPGVRVSFSGKMGGSQP